MLSHNLDLPNMLASTHVRGNDYLARSPKIARFLAAVLRVVRIIDYRIAEILLATLAVCTGLWLVCIVFFIPTPPAPDHIIYTVLASYMPPTVWAAILIAAALPSFRIYRCGTHWRKCSRRYRIVGNCVLLSMWVIATLLVIKSPVIYLLSAWLPVFVFYQAWGLLALWLGDR